jgi:hypothetical protein
VARMLYRFGLLSLALLLSGRPLAHGQAGGSFEPLAPRLDSMRMLLERPTDVRDIGMLWDELAVTPHADGPALRRVYRTLNTLFGNQLDTVYSTVPELRPLTHRTAAGVQLEDIHFRADSIVGWVQPSGQARRSVARRADARLYDSHTFDLLVRRAPLAEGYELVVPAFLNSVDTAVTLRATVTGSARVEVERGREVESWVVKLDFAGLASTMWVEKETRRLARQVIELGGGVSMVMDRLPRVPGEVRTRRGA